MEELEMIKRYAQSKACVSVPQIQKDLQLPYRNVREAVGKLVESNVLAPDGELNFKLKETKKACVSRRRTGSSSGVYSRIDMLRERLTEEVSQAEQNKINNDCSDEKYAEFIEESKKRDDDKITLICCKKDAEYARMIEDFNKLPAFSQSVLTDAMAKSPDAVRYKLYLQLRRTGEEKVKYSREYVNHNIVLTFLLKTSDEGFEKLKKMLKIR